VLWLSQRAAGYGVGSKNMTERLCYLAAAKDHVNVGFNYGAELNVPTGLPRGAGKPFALDARALVTHLTVIAVLSGSQTRKSAA